MNESGRSVNSFLVDWASAACADWGFDNPAAETIDIWNRRLPPGLQGMIALGIGKGIVLPQGRTFSLQGLAAGKGPYNWFSKDNARRMPTPNWEYFVQVGEYVRLVLPTHDLDFQVTFEDDLMDIGVHRQGHLVLCCEVKETPRQAADLIAAIGKHTGGVDWTVSDRGNDPLRKAKYILKRKPAYFSVVAIGTRYEFSVEHKDEGFALKPDLVPLY